MILALAHTARQQPFNSLLYATVATVIPVFYLAIAVQGRMYGDVLRFARTAYRKFQQEEPGQRLLGSALGYIILSELALTLAFLILLYSTLGEIDALVSLERGRPYGEAGTVLFSAMFLTVVVAIGPALTLVRGLRGYYAGPALPAAPPAKQRPGPPRSGGSPVRPPRPRSAPGWAKTAPPLHGQRLRHGRTGPSGGKEPNHLRGDRMGHTSGPRPLSPEP